MTKHHAHANGLKRNLKSRHIIMMALGGAIGAGLFQGSDESISQTGPGALVAYVLGGAILFLVMRSLGELAVHQTGADTFRDLVEPVLGSYVAQLTGWIYWLDWVLVMAAETAAAAGFLHYWLPQASLWVLALIVSIGMTLLNLLQVSVYGESEYWLAAIKIVVLVLFTVFGFVLLFIGIQGHPGTGFRHLTDTGGFFPHGWAGFASSLLVVMFSFGGTEMVGMTLGETEHPERVIPRAARNVILRILLFYVLPIFVIVCLVPWNQLGDQSPFVTVFTSMGIPYIGGFMNLIMLTAVLSATNSGMYAASRMLYDQALAGNAPRFFATLSPRGVPVRALLVSTSFLYIGVIIAVFAKGQTFGYLMTIPGYSVILVWAIIALTHLLSRTTQTRMSRLGSCVAILALCAILVGIILTTPLWGTVVMVCLLVVVTVGYLLSRRVRTS